MNFRTGHDSSDDPIAAVAATWVLRRDRGLTAAEQDALSQWLAADARHRAAFAECAHGWTELDRLAGLQTSTHAVPDPDLLAPQRSALARRLVRWAPVALAAAAVVALGIFVRSGSPAPGARPAPPAAVATIRQLTLPDGSTVQLNRGAAIAVEFTPAERRVRLVRGEGNFAVAKNAAWPFVVVSRGVEVHAVGTAFNVRLGESAVEVIVTEGKVRVDHPDEHSPVGTSAAVPLLVAGEQAVVPFAPVAPVPPVVALSPAQLAEKLAWQPRWLDFNNAALTDIAAEFNRHNPMRLVLADATIGALRLSASFRSDNVEGFVRLMESDFGVTVERRGEEEIELRLARR